jgi:hypothetical protein
MKNAFSKSTLTLLALVSVLFYGCSNNNNPISAFEPEVINNADAFQFQVTDATNVTATLSYSWSNTGTRASIDHSTALTDGSATVTILDNDNVQVYTSGLVASATDASNIGVPGTWTVTVVLTGFSGTANFRAEKL